MAIRGVKLRKLMEQEHEAGRGATGFRQEFRKRLGLSENFRTGEPTLDRSKQEVNASDFDFAEVTQEFFGREIDGKRLRHILEQGNQLKLQEAEGAVVQASHFANISAYTDVVGGLVDALVLEGYENPDYIGDELFTAREAKVNGGKRIRPTNDGGVSANLALGQPYPTVGLGETYVQIPENERNGVRIALGEAAMIYDRTGEIQERCQTAGETVRRKKEVRQADVALGKTNTYNRDGVNSNTFRTATLATAAYNKTKPMEFINAKTSQALNDWQDLNAAVLTLGANKDPATGFEISIRRDDADLIVMPHREALASTILSATTLQTRTATPISGTQATTAVLDVRNHGNPVSTFAKRLMSSWIWYNRMLLAGTDCADGHTGALDATLAIGDAASKAQSVWLWGNFKKALEYRVIIPFETFQAPISADEVARDIVGVWIAREWGVPWVVEPRYIFCGADTYTA